MVERKLPKLEVAGSTPVRRLQWQSNIWLWNALSQHEVLNWPALVAGQTDGAVTSGVLSDVQPLVGGRHQRPGVQSTVGAGGHAD